MNLYCQFQKVLSTSIFCCFKSLCIFVHTTVTHNTKPMLLCKDGMHESNETKRILKMYNARCFSYHT